ncbi:polycomb group protein FIE2 [Artemisia annua]|uniref:Polycomb group protein FIE2 n=1 Tax=Artemisia annua TaxID=35608 RepID=A0A2U1NL51_ARTAN|nr:polycomb group protein FIE2 [Artemisia annua]
MVKTPFGCDPVVGSLTPSKEYRVTNRIQEETKHGVYDAVFNFIDSRYYNVFATVSRNRYLFGTSRNELRDAYLLLENEASTQLDVTVYQCLEGGAIAVLQSYIDEDKDESFYTVSWACDADGRPMLVAGGINGIIRVIDAGKEKIHKSLVGHGRSVNEIRTQALRPSLVLSASKDESVRLWNVETGICILIFAGAGGHRNEVLSVDFHPSDIYRIASCGMDNTVKIWSIKAYGAYLIFYPLPLSFLTSAFHRHRKEILFSFTAIFAEFRTDVERSFTWKGLPSQFPTKYVQFPVLLASIHTNYVNCNRWIGDFMLSKSVDNEFILWEPKMKEHSPGEGTVDIIQKYPVPESDIGFIKLSFDFHYNAAAIGNKEGKIFVWELQTRPPTLIARLSHVLSKSPIKQTAMSFDGSTILSCCEDGTIWRWDTVATS